MALAETWYEIVLPPVMTLIVVIVAIALLWLVRRQVGEFVSQVGVRRVSALGVEVDFTERRAVEAHTERKIRPPSENDRVAIRAAAERLIPLAAQCRVLWVDNAPGGNQLERSTMVSWEVDVQAVRDTATALRELSDKLQRFDLIISDWHRPGDTREAPAGPELAREVARLGLEFEPRILFYHGPVELPELMERRSVARELGAVGATGIPGELFRWTLVELARAALDRPRPEQRKRWESDEG
jgi:CheY-like chemotaxis protein